MIDKVEVQDCVLCGSCINSCPVDAISFRKKSLDFNYPEIDLTKCIGCGKCEKVCPVLGKEMFPQEKFPIAYAARNKNSEMRISSTSGGIFIAAADNVIAQGGYVCGAIFDESFQVKHICTNDIAKVRQMMGSKYAQSDMCNTFDQIKELLEQDKQILFTGCPCQIAALTTFLGKKYSKLILMELICHGIPSNQMLQSYIELQEKKNGGKLIQFQFRNKNKGWHRSEVVAKFDNGRIYSSPITVDAYMRGFLGNTYLKESCYHCQFRKFQSGADLMLGDFWGAEVEMSELDDNTGISAVLVCSEKAKEFLFDLDVECYNVEVEKVIRYNKNILESAVPNKNRVEFYQYASEKGYSSAINKFLWEKPIEKCKRKMKFVIRCIYHKIMGRQKPLY